jgi:hypothetical protein
LLADRRAIGAELNVLRLINFETAIVDTRHFSFEPELDKFCADARVLRMVSESEIADVFLNVPPFAYTERLLLEKDATTSIMRTFFTETLKLRPTRQSVEAMSVELFHVLLVAATHPILAMQLLAPMTAVYKVAQELGLRSMTEFDHLRMLAASRRAASF